MIKIVGKIDLDSLKEVDVLGELTPLFEEDFCIDELSKAEKDKLYQVFKRDIIKSPPQIDGKPLMYNKNRSRHPDFRNMPDGFVHCVTRKNEYKGKREFDPDRAQKIHWIKPVIENASDPRIKYFEDINDKGDNQKFYWYEEKSFLIIVREVTPDHILITSFDVDSYKVRTYQEQYNNYRNRQKKTSLRK